MMPGMPAGRQLAASLSSGGAARYAFRFASYAGVSEGLCEAAPAAPRAPGLISQTPVKSGILASAAQSAAVGALVVTFWARAPAPDVITSAESTSAFAATPA